eukprot:364433-Chlamydomonas_euryale.AAC.9
MCVPGLSTAAAAVKREQHGSSCMLQQRACLWPDMRALFCQHLRYPNNVYFMDRQGPGQHALYNVLRAYAAYNTGTGYVQVRARSPWRGCGRTQFMAWVWPHVL